LNSELHPCKVGTLPLEPYLQSILLWLFWSWVLKTICLGWSQTLNSWISPSQVARIMGVSHWHLAKDHFLEWQPIVFDS
jgi:hypothetical protein